MAAPAGTSSARWQATWWAGAASRSCGTSVRQRSTARASQERRPAGSATAARREAAKVRPHLTAALSAFAIVVADHAVLSATGEGAPAIGRSGAYESYVSQRPWRDLPHRGLCAHSLPGLAMHKHTAWPAVSWGRDRNCQRCGAPDLTARRPPSGAASIDPYRRYPVSRPG
jgi:hypothetical protein